MRERDKDEALTPFELLLAGGAAAAISAGALLWAVARLTFLEGLGVIGTGVTVASLLLAIMIFRAQKRRSDLFERRLFGREERKIGRQMASEPASSNEPDPFEAEVRLFPGFGEAVDGAKNVRRWGRDEVPLKLIADLVHAWEAKPEEHDGAWSVGDLHSVLRRAGKGNHAFRFLFVQDGVLRIFRLSRGGRGKPGDTVEEEKLLDD